MGPNFHGAQFISPHIVVHDAAWHIDRESRWSRSTVCYRNPVAMGQSVGQDREAAAARRLDGRTVCAGAI